MQTALDLFAEMEKADILSKNKLHELHEVLKEFDQQLAQTVQRYMDGKMKKHTHRSSLQHITMKFIL